MKQVDLYVDSLFRIPATTTGRWKTVITDGVVKIHLECTYCIPSIHRMKITDWVSEDYLTIVETEEFINTCGE